MANQLRMAVVETIISLRRRGWSRRRIAEELGIDRETVARHLGEAQNESKPASAPPGSDRPAAESKPASNPLAYGGGKIAFSERFGQAKCGCGRQAQPRRQRGRCG
jgi:Homeodomain-like domain